MKGVRKMWGLVVLVCALAPGCMTNKKPVLAAASSAAVNLTGTQWSLEDLGGKAVIQNSRATLAFPEAGRVAGNGSCNRFTGSAEIKGGAIQLGPLAATRMMCEGEASAQEAEYLKALERAQRFEVKDGKLYLYL